MNLNYTYLEQSRKKNDRFIGAILDDFYTFYIMNDAYLSVTDFH